MEKRETTPFTNEFVRGIAIGAAGYLVGRYIGWNRGVKAGRKAGYSHGIIDARLRMLDQILENSQFSRLL